MWRYANPVNVVFGAGALDGIGKAIGGRAYGLVTYGDDCFSAMAERIEGSAGTPVLAVDDVVPNPDFEALDRACRVFGMASAQPQVVVALGGGSVIDTAKVMVAAAGDFGRVRAYLDDPGAEAPVALVPVIAVPTTAGTGSEVTRFATVWDSKAKKKYSLALESIYPETALVDPLLALTAPRGLSVATGLDALSHALESIWNVNANPVSTALAIEAARGILDNLVALAADLGDVRLRERMARAATLAGLAMSNTETALAHALSYPVTLNNGVEHGIACSFSLPLVMRRAIGCTAECDAALRSIFGPDLEAGATRLAEFLHGLGISTDPGDHGMREAEWSALLASALDGARGRNFLRRQPGHPMPA